MTDQLTSNDLDMREALNDAQRDRIILRVIALLAGGLVVLFTALIALSNAGVIQPNCDHLPLNNRVGQCYVSPATSDATIIAPTPNPGQYNLPSLDLRK